MVIFLCTFFFAITVTASTPPICHDGAINFQTFQDLIERQEQQVKRLEETVKALRDSLDRIHLPFIPDPPPPVAAQTEAVAVPKIKFKKESGVKVESYRPAWTDRFQFLSAISVSSGVSCISALPHDEDDGVSRYLAVGDNQGRIYVVLAHGGDAVLEFQTASGSPVTAMLSYSLSNQTVLITGHGDGAVIAYNLWENNAADDALGVLGFLGFEHRLTLSEGGEDAEGVKLMQIHQIGKTRYVICSGNNSGKLRVFHENGTLHGVAEFSSRPLALLKQRLLFLTELGVSSLDLRTMRTRAGSCDGLNGSRAVAYAFDPAERSKGYGVTSEGELIHVVLMGDVKNFECRVRAKRKTEIRGDNEVVIRAIKGYLLVGTEDRILVFNSTLPNYVRAGGPRHLFHASLDEIASSFGQKNAVVRSDELPLVSCNKDRLVAVGLGDGYVAIFRSNMPLYKPEFNTMLWGSPVIVFVMFLIGAWVFFGKKREAFSIWANDDMFTTPPSTITAGTNALSAGASEDSGRELRDRDLRDRDIRDLRDIRSGPSRRYASPSRYPTATQSSFGTKPGGITFRSSAVDLNYR